MLPAARFREWFADALIDGENYVEVPEPLCLGFADRVRTTVASSPDLSHWGCHLCLLSGHQSQHLCISILLNVKHPKDLLQMQIRDMEGVIQAHFEGKPEPAIPWTNNKPWEIAANLRRLVDEHIQMNDIRRYAFDVLQKAGSLQRFKHKPHPAAKCLSGNDVLVSCLVWTADEDGSELCCVPSPKKASCTEVSRCALVLCRRCSSLILTGT